MLNDRSRLLKLPVPPILMLGHTTVDTFMNLLSGLLPVLTVAHGLSYLLAGTLAMVANVTSSLIQPILGRWYDRTQTSWILQAGMVANCVGMSLVGIAPNYLILVVLITITGIGHAAFHPPAYSTVIRLSISAKGKATGVFLAAGNVGWFVGPISAGILVSIFGLWSTILLLPLGLIVAIFVFKELVIPREEFASTREQRPIANKRLLGLLGTIASFRSITTQIATAFLPIYLIANGYTLFMATALTSLWLAIAVVGQICGGHISDRVGRRIVIVTTLLIGSVLFYGFLVTGGLLSIMFLLLSGAFLYANWSVIVVMAIEVAPGNVGAVSGLMLGFTMGIGGVAAAIFGAAADIMGLATAFHLIAAFPVIGGLLAVSLPRQISKS